MSAATVSDLLLDHLGEKHPKVFRVKTPNEMTESLKKKNDWTLQTLEILITAMKALLMF